MLNHNINVDTLGLTAALKRLYRLTKEKQRLEFEPLWEDDTSCPVQVSHM